MGVDAATTEFLISGMKIGIVPGRVCTLGRQQLFCPPRRIKALLRKYGIDAKGDYAVQATRFAEDLFSRLGFLSCDSVDASDYESATIVHDLNRPVADDLHERFDLVLDGGTLEHVFNFPVALKNAMEMTKVEGALVIHNCMNNLAGHGFYQFSPELFYRALSGDNGFRVVRMFVYAREGEAYSVADPADVRGRVQLINDAATHILVHAERTRRAEIFAASPQQSDYAQNWESASRAPPGADDGPVKKALRRRLSPKNVARISAALNVVRQKRAVRRVLREASLANRKLYTPVSSWAVRRPQAWDRATSKSQP